MKIASFTVCFMLRLVKISLSSTLALMALVEKWYGNILKDLFAVVFRLSLLARSLLSLKEDNKTSPWNGLSRAEKGMLLNALTLNALFRLTPLARRRF